MFCALLYEPLGENVLSPTPPMIPVVCIEPTASIAYPETLPISANVAGCPVIGIGELLYSL